MKHSNTISSTSKKLSPINKAIIATVAGIIISFVAAIAPVIMMMSNPAVVESNDPTKAMSEVSASQGIYHHIIQYTVMFAAASAVVAWLFSAKKPAKNELNFALPRTITPYVIGAGVAIASFFLMSFLSRLSPEIVKANETVATQVRYSGDLMRDIAITFGTTIIGPIGEEIIYRGLIFGGIYLALRHMAKKLPEWVAFAIAGLVSSVLFAIAHGGEGQSTQFPLLVLYGMIFAGVYWKSRSLPLTMFTHCTVNAINFMVIALSIKNTSIHPLVYVMIVAAPFIGLSFAYLLEKIVYKTIRTTLK